MPSEQKFGIFYRDKLLAAFTREMRDFILYLFQENRAVHELVTADYSILNDKLQTFL